MRKTLLFFAVLLNYLSASGEQKQTWEYPSNISFFSNTNSDTSYYLVEDSGNQVSHKGPVWRIKRGNILSDFYFNGRLQSVSMVEEKGQHNKVDKIFNYNGFCRIYFNDSTNAIAATGQYKKNKIFGEWKYYDHQGRLVQKSYPVNFWQRSDYYDSIGRLTEQIDQIADGNKMTIVKDVKFINGKDEIVVDMNFFTWIFLRFDKEIAAIFLSLFFLRLPFNHILLRRESISNGPLLWYIGSNASYSESVNHQLWVMYSFLWFKVKPENKWLATIINTLSISLFVFILGLFMVAAISGSISR